MSTRHVFYAATIATLYGLLCYVATSVAGDSAATPQRKTDRYGDPLPAGAIDRLGTVRFRHDGLVRQVLYHPDGKSLATVGFDSVILWNPETGKRIRTIKYPHAIQSAAFSGDGRLLASVDDSGTLVISETASGRKLQTFQAHELPSVLAFSPDGRYVACGGHQRRCQVWNRESGTMVHEDQECAASHIACLQFSPNGKLLGIGYGNETMHLLDTSTWKQVKTHPAACERFRFSPDGKRLLCSHQQTLTWWDLESGKAVHRIEEHPWVGTVAIDPGAKLVAHAAGAGKFKIRDLETSKLIAEHASFQLFAECDAFSPDGTRLVTSSGQSLELWDTKNWTRLSRFDGPDLGTPLVGFGDDGKQVLSFHSWQPHWQVRRWDVATCKEIGRIEHHDKGLYRETLLSRDGRWLIGWQGESANSDEKQPTIYRIWDTHTGEQGLNIEVPNWAVDQIALSSSRNILAVPGNQEKIALWDLDAKKVIRSFKLLEAAPSEANDKKALPPNQGSGGPQVIDSAPPPPQILALSPQADWLALMETDSSKKTSIAVRDTVSGSCRCRIIPAKFNGSLAFFSGGRSLAVVATDDDSSHVEIWETCSGKCRRRFRSIPERLTAMDLSPDGRLIACKYENGVIRVWDVAGKEPSTVLDDHVGGPRTLAFSPDGRIIASPCWDTSILLWKSVPPLRQKRPGEEAMQQCWKDLSGTDAQVAFSAVLQLADHPALSQPFLEAKLAADKGPTREQVHRLLADLDSDNTEARDRAFQELALMGDRIRPAVDQALASTTSLEVKVRCEALIRKIGQRENDPDLLRRERIAEILQMIGTPEASELGKRILSVRVQAAK